MEPDKTYSLSHFLSLQTKGQVEKGFSLADMLKILKALKEREAYSATLLALAKASGLQAPVCQAICVELEKEGFVSINPDNDMGNDTVMLTKKGKESL